MSRPKLHSFINCVLPTSASLLSLGRGKIDVPVRFLIIDHDKHGLILVDSGYGPEIHALKGFKAVLYRSGIRVPKEGLVTPAEAVAHLGYRMKDIRHVIFTHIHADHICNLDSIPDTAEIHMSSLDISMMQGKNHPDMPKQRFMSGIFPGLMPAKIVDRARAFETAKLLCIGNLDAMDIVARDILGDGSVMALPLHGHSASHYGVVLPKGIRNGEGMFVYGADTAWTNAGLCAPERIATLIEHDNPDANLSRQVVRALAPKPENLLLCHNPEIRDTDIGVGV